jgi:hypothetical protein
MRRYAQIALAVWFAIVTGMVQACAGPAMTLNHPASGSSVNSSARSFTPGTYPAYPPLNSTTASTADPVSSASPSKSLTDPPEFSPDSTGYTKDKAESQALTDYLKHHRLPLVGAQVMEAPNGKRKVMLYGFVATDFGKADAVTKTRRFLHDSTVAVDNRVNVRPELASANSSSAAPGSSIASSANESSAGTKSYPGVKGYMEQEQREQALAQQQLGSGSTLSMVLPLIALIGVLGAGMAVGSGSLGGFGGFSSGPFGPPPSFSPFGNYNPYPGYPAPVPYPAYPPSYSYPSAPAYPPYP